MTADGTEYERALEARVARLEARLRHLEGAAGFDLGAQTAAEHEARPVVASPAMAAAALPPPSEPLSTALTAMPAWLAPAVSPFATPTLIQAPPGSRCGSCGKPLSPVWKSGCKHCGAPYARFAPILAPAAGPSTPPGWTPPHMPPQAPAARPAGQPGGPRPRPEPRLPWAVRFPDLSGSFDEIEARLAGRALAWVGGLALVLGMIFFLSLAFSRGWIGPELRVVMGLAAGAAAMAGGAAFMERGNRLLGHVLTPVGLAVISISLIAATSIFHLIPVEIGLLGALMSAIAAAVIAVRADSQVVAAFGLIAVLIAPPLMGASPDLLTLLFVAIVLVGTTGIALWRSWSWLPPVAFVLSAPQAANWVSGGPEPALGLAGIALFWLLNIVAAGGEAFRRRRDDLSTSSATLLLANVAFLIWAGFQVLDRDLATYRGFFLVLVALAHIGIGGYFVVRDGERNLFGLLAIGTGIAALTMAAPIQLGAPAVPIAWTAEAVALAWLAARRGHPYSALVSGLLYAMAGAYLISLYMDLEPPLTGVAFANATGATLGFFAAGVAAGVWFARDRSLRSVLTAFGLAVALVCMPQVLVPATGAIAMTLLMVVGAAGWRVLPLLPSTPIVWQVDGLLPRAMREVGPWRDPADAALPLVTVFVGVTATVLLVGSVYGPAIFVTPSGTPFVDPAGAALAIYLIGLAAVAWISGRSALREPLAAIGLLVIAYACPAEFDGVVLVAAWAGLMVLGFALWRGLAALPHDPPIVLVPEYRAFGTSDLLLPLAALVAGGLAVLHVLVDELPLSRFGKVTPPEVPFTDDGAVVAMILVVAVLATGAIIRGALARRVSILIAGGVVAYTIPFEVYAWAVSVLWVALGGLALVLIRPDRDGRPAYLIAATSLVGGAGLVAIGIVAPPSRLVVGTAALQPIVLLQSIAAIGAVVAGLVAIARTGRAEIWARWAWIGAGVSVVYLCSVAVVGLVSTQIGGAIATEELRTQGQVALSVTWMLLGVVAFVTGLRFRIDDLRHGGLALLGLATAKVFLFDLSALDVAYRVISLIALGLLLLMSAWLWQRLQPRTAGAPDDGVTPQTSEASQRSDAPETSETPETPESAPKPPTPRLPTPRHGHA